jgi:hypothetical protein
MWCDVGAAFKSMLLIKDNESTILSIRKIFENTKKLGETKF